MSRCLNRAELIGYLGAAPEIRMLDNGQAMATFSVATSWRWQDAHDEAQDATEWSRCVVFGPLAEWCGDKLVKGSRVYARGRLRTRTWEDRSGVRRERTEIVVHELIGFDVEQPAPSALTMAAGGGGEQAGAARAPPRMTRRR